LKIRQRRGIETKKKRVAKAYSLLYGGKFKTTSNEIAKTLLDRTTEVIFSSLELYETSDAVRALCEIYRNEIDKGKLL
jgi:hypothetical protein